MSKVDYGYPFGWIRTPWSRPWDHGFCVVIRAACDADDHDNHPFCDPYWRQKVEQADAIILAGPVLTDSGWQVLVLTNQWVGQAIEMWPDEYGSKVAYARMQPNPPSWVQAPSEEDVSDEDL